MKQKFTLIELLVVVAIIGILSSMLLPAIGKARAKARAGVCVSNLKNVAVGVILYVDGNNDYFPKQKNTYDPIAYYENDSLSIILWGSYQVVIDQILESKDVFKCPASLQADPAASFSYDLAMNAALHSYNETHVSINALSKPSEVLVNADTNSSWLQPSIGSRIEVRHGNNVNTSWVDGHVEAKSWRSLYNNAQWGHFIVDTPFSYAGSFTFAE
ncbi:MAG: prepilin-type N-terminal cleavage/methylation domain-containing protein [Lentisphaeraceae bacterium]|nr:prepilin-type N-terminal cleavage/methylation domain-containing protein [Lentisphaeraceae bacterium]